MKEIKCNFSNALYDFINYHCSLYICAINNYAFDDDEEFVFVGNHIKLKTNLDVKLLILDGKSLTKVPQGLMQHFPNIVALEIRESSVKSLTKSDIAEYKRIRMFKFDVNPIEFLPGNLFEDFNNLEYISFSSCNLLTIEPFILDFDKENPAEFRFSMRSAKFLNNPNYHIEYSGWGSLNVIETELYRKYYILYPHKLTTPQQMIQNTLTNDFNNFLKNENFKDFTIKILNHEFRAHKFLLAARSSVLADMIQKNPDAENLNLIDISVETFKQVLHFIYNDELNQDKEEIISFINLFAAAGRLNIEVLKNIAAAHLLDEIYSENALNILSLSNRYNHKILKDEAFAFIKKTNTYMTFKSEWANQPEVLARLIEIHKEKESAMKKFNEEYEKLTKSDGN